MCCSRPPVPPLCSRNPWTTSPWALPLCLWGFSWSFILFIPICIPLNFPAFSASSPSSLSHPSEIPVSSQKIVLLINLLLFLFSCFFTHKEMKFSPLTALLQLISSGGLLWYQINVWWQGWASFSDPLILPFAHSHPLSIFRRGLSPRASGFSILLFA